MIKEKDFEDIICKYPELIEESLTFKGRQVTLYGRRMDILFEDKFNRKLIIELKAGPIKDEHIGQILSYEGMLLSADDPTIRVMLIGTRVPPNIQKSLDHHGIAWREISFSKLREFLLDHNDDCYLNLFEFYEEPRIQRKIELQNRDSEKEEMKHISSANNKLRYSNIKEDLSEMKIIDHSKYSVTQIFEKQKVGKFAEELLLNFHKELSQKLVLQKLPWMVRTNDRGFSYLAKNNKTFLWLSLSQQYISIRCFTGNSTIEGLKKGIWVNKDDNLGSETYRIANNNTLINAVDFAIEAYKIAVDWTGWKTQ